MEAKPYKIHHPFKKLSQKLIDKIVKDIEEGSTVRFSTRANGITEGIFYVWIDQGIIDLETEKENSLPAILVESLAKVHQKEVKWCRKAILKEKSGHKGAEWTLEHAYRKDFGPEAALKELVDDIEEFKVKLYKGSQYGKINEEGKEQIK